MMLDHHLFVVLLPRWLLASVGWFILFNYHILLFAGSPCYGSFSSQALEMPCRWSNWQLILLESWDQCCSIWATYLPSTSQRCSSISKLLICLFCFFFFVHIFFSNNNILKCNPLRAHVPSSLTVLQEETQEEQVQEPFSVLQTILCSSIFARV